MSMEHLENRVAIEELIGRYGYHYDEYRFEEWLTDLFTPDVVCTRRVAGEPEEQIFRGHEELRQGLKPRLDAYQERGLRRRHVQTGIWISELADDRAHAQSICVIFATPPGGTTYTAAAGHYEFDVVRRDGRWWISAWLLSLDGPPA
jgi:SnoaL-like domain